MERLISWRGMRGGFIWSIESRLGKVLLCLFWEKLRRSSKRLNSQFGVLFASQ